MTPGSLVFLALMFAVLWLLLIRPQRRRQLEQQRMMDALEVGDEIVTVGGLFGHVRAIDGDELQVEIAPGTTVRVARRAVASVFETDGDDEAAAEGEEPVAEAAPDPAAEAAPEPAEPLEEPADPARPPVT